MISITRLLVLATVAAFAAQASAQEVADRIWTGGPILTLNDAAMRAEAVAVGDGRILAVGSRSDVMKLKGPATQVVDLGGRALLPGFIDPHGHMIGGGMQSMVANLLAPPDGEIRSIGDIQRTLRDWMTSNEPAVRKANLVLGFGYDNSQLEELRHPTRDDLDAVSKDVPILIVHQSAHLAVMNTRALEVAGIDAQSKDPAGGVIRRRPGSTEPDGVLEETAFNENVTKLFSRLGPETLKAFARAGAEQWARFGYTTAQEGRAVPATTNALRTVANEGGFKIDVVAYNDVLGDRDYIRNNASRTYTNRFRLGGAKLTIDGSPQGFTAWRDRPYYKPVGNYPVGYAGYPASSVDQIVEAVDWAYANDIQILTHASGEAASDALIAASTFAELNHGRGKDRRPVLIHGHFQRQDQVDAYQRLGVIGSLFPMHTYYWGDWHVNHTVGPELGPNITPTGWYRERGMIFTTHHDAPVAFPDSIRVLSATVTRKARGSGNVIGPDQRVDVITALKAMTIWPAYQYFEEAEKGSIETGKLADFVVLSADPTSVEPEALDQLKVVETIKEGVTIHRLEAMSQRARTSVDWSTVSSSHALAGLFGAPEGECPGEFFTELAVLMSEGGHVASGSAQ